MESDFPLESRNNIGSQEKSAPSDSAPSRNPVEILADEFAQRIRNGENPEIEEYVQRCPDYEKEIRLIFPSIESVEKIGDEEAQTRKNQRDSNRFFQSKLDKIADFEIIKELGRGGMGIVYEANQKSLNRKVALKTINPAISNSPTQLKRFQREAEAAARLQHTNIIQIFGIGEADGLHFYAMQLVKGFSLSELIGSISLDDTTARIPSTFASTGGDSIPRNDSEFESGEESPDLHSYRTLSHEEYLKWVCQIICDVAHALDYAHDNGVFHRDIKPANILIENQGTVLISDFGLAKFSGFDELTQAGDLVGTLRYMAPEQFEGEIDARTDIYSLGLTLFELLTLKPAFSSNQNSNSISIRDRKAQPNRIRSIDQRIPIDLQTITEKAVSADPAHRFQSAGEFGDELKRFIEGTPIKSRRVTWYESLYRWSKRNPAVASLSAISIILLVAVAIVGVVGNLETRKAMAGMQSEYDRAEFQKNRAQENLSIAKEAIQQILDNLSQRGTFQQKSYRFEDEEFVGASARLSQADIDMLTILLNVFTRFSKANEENLSLESAEANSTIGDIYQKLGRYEDAVDAYSTAFQQYQSFLASQPMENLAPPLRTLNELAVTAGLSGDKLTADRTYQLSGDFYRKHETELSTAEGQFEYARSLNIYASTGSRVAPFTFFEARPRRDIFQFIFEKRRSPPRPGFEPSPKKHGKGKPGRFGSRKGRRPGGDWPRPGRGQGKGNPYFGDRKDDPSQPGRGNPGRGNPGPGKSGPGKPGHGKPSHGKQGPGERRRENEKYLFANQTAEKILNKLISNDPTNIQYQLALARSMADRLRLMRHFASKDVLNSTLDKAKRILSGLIEQHPDSPLLKFELANTLMNNLVISSSSARTQIKEAIQISESLSKDYPEVYEYQAQHADAIAMEADLNARYSSKLDDSKAKLKSALDIYENITIAQPDAHQFLFSYVLHLNSYADLLERQRKKDEATAERERALAILEKLGLPKSTNSPINRIKQAIDRKLKRPNNQFPR